MESTCKNIITSLHAHVHTDNTVASYNYRESQNNVQYGMVYKWYIDIDISGLNVCNMYMFIATCIPCMYLVVYSVHSKATAAMLILP